MSWTNYHGHCTYCDGHKGIEDYIIEAINRGMTTIGISSHAPVPFDCFWTMNSNDLELYVKEMEGLKSKYHSKVNVLTSLEIDYVPEITGPDFPFLQNIELDYKIGSIHFVDQFKNGEHWAIDGSFDEFKKGLDHIFNGDIQKAVQRFFQLTRQMVQTQKFEIIGHFDKIKMHNKAEILFDESSDWYKAEINDTLNYIVRENIIVEVNTKSFGKDGLLFPGIELFPLMLDKKIPVTINSDAHYPDKLELGFDYVAEALLNAGYKYLREYVNGEWLDVEFTKEGIIW